MGSYLLKRIFLLIPTLFGALLLNFLLLKALPGSPLDYLMGDLYGGASADGGVSTFNGGIKEVYGEGLPEDYQKTQASSSFEKGSLWKQFTSMAWRYLLLDFGQSYFQDKTVVQLIQERMPVSLSLGLFSLIIIYGLAIGLGIQKARREESFFDRWTSFVLTFFYAMPNFLLALLLIIFFAGGFYWSWFPLQGLYSENWAMLSWPQKILDYTHHMVLPLITIVLGGMGSFTFFIKSAFLEELKKPYVQAVYARGGSQKCAIYRHALKHVMLNIVSHFPHMFMRIFLMNTLVIEMIFSLDGMGFLMLQSILKRDYPVILGIFFVFTLLSLFVQIVVDISYFFLDPRVHFRHEKFYE